MTEDESKLLKTLRVSDIARSYDMEILKAIWVSGELALGWTNVLVTIAAVVGAATVSFRYIVDRVPGLKDWLYSLWVKD